MEENAQALGNVVLYSVEYDDFEKLLSYVPETARHIFETIYARQQQFEHKFRAINFSYSARVG